MIHKHYLNTCFAKYLHKHVQNKWLSYSKSLTTSKELYQKQNDITTEDDLLEDKEYNSLVGQYLGELDSHNCYIIQPYIKWGKRKLRDTTPELQLSEAIGMIQTLNTWKVIDTIITPLESLAKKTIFGSGTLRNLQNSIRENPNVTAVFINIGVITNIQIGELEKVFKVPILDRYKIVMQILRVHATTKHAKLQVALAELPYLQTRLKMQFSQILVSDNYDTRRLMLQNREQKLKMAIRKLRSQRQLLRNRRTKINYPVIAVVGYTNAGKTCLIKALTDEENLHPQDKLFATLDVTLHAGILPSNLKVLFVDTVGFISDIPTGLIECFIVTLEDAIHADIILHVEDLSNEDRIHQRNHVLSTVQNLSQKLGAENIVDKIITVGNKCDIAGENIDYTNLKISSKTYSGIDILRHRLEDEVIRRTGRLKLTITVPVDGNEIRWLYKNATVTNVTEDETNPENEKMKIIISESKLHQFKSIFI